MQLDFPRWKIWLVIATIALGLLAAFPSLLPEKTRDTLPGWLADTHINLGLDLSGGSQLLLEADVTDVRKQQLTRMEEAVRTEMRRADPRIEIGEISTTGGRLAFIVRDGTQLDRAVEIARNQTNAIGVTGQRDWNVSVQDSTSIVMVPTAAGTTDSINTAMETARNVVAKRIDPDGTKEVTVLRQGTDRILVQVPGLQDPESLKRILGKTAKLEFKMVDTTADPALVAQGIAPAGSEILPYPEAQGGRIVVKRRVMVSGDELNNAQQTFDQRDNSPAVSLTFNSQGGRKFGRATTDNVGKPFAIILDGVVISAPNINEPILGGNAQISGGGFTVETANELAVSLKAGKLPTALKVIEESTVSPELGKDSIRSGVLAGIIATIALVGYMLLTYLRFGVYTTLALFLNALLVLGGMALFNASLTLPGIAGFVLTIGAAVDANVLINERIREELRRGRKTLSAVEFGYKEASTAIFDANITNVISAVILFWFGTGPIKGFAVVLAIGIITSVFTGVTFTRLLVADYLRRERPKSLNL